MTLSEILSLAQSEYGDRNQITPEQALAFANSIQQMAFNRDLDAFLVWDSYVTVNSVTPQGPYSYPISPLCRKFLGVTAYTDDQLLNFVTETENTTDYGLPISSINERQVYRPIRNNVIDRTWSFVESSPSEEEDNYRAVYYRRAPVMRSATDDDNLLIDAEFHYTTMVLGITALAEFTTYGDKAPADVLDRFLRPYWDKLIYSADDGNLQGYLSDGQPGL